MGTLLSTGHRDCTGYVPMKPALVTQPCSLCLKPQSPKNSEPALSLCNHSHWPNLDPTKCWQTLLTTKNLVACSGLSTCCVTAVGAPWHRIPTWTTPAVCCHVSRDPVLPGQLNLLSWSAGHSLMPWPCDTHPKGWNCRQNSGPGPSKSLAFGGDTVVQLFPYSEEKCPRIPNSSGPDEKQCDCNLGPFIIKILPLSMEK